MKKEEPNLSDRRQFIKKSAAAGLGVGVGLAAAKGALQPKRAEAQEAQTEIRWGFLIDVNKCTGCNACAVACKTENDVRLGVFRNSIRIYESGTERSFVPWLCNHCANPACLTKSDGTAVCPVEARAANFEMPDGSIVQYEQRATYQRPDGLVLVDQDRCIGCGNCVRACPYQVRYLDPVKRAGGDATKGAADKCTLCEHRLREGRTPACVDTCPASARLAGDLNDSTSEIAQAIAGNTTAVLLAAAGTNPQCYYIGLSSDTPYTAGRDTRSMAPNPTGL